MSNKDLVEKMVNEGGGRPQFTYTVTHIGSPQKSGVKVEKHKAYFPQTVLAKFKGRQMTKDEIDATKKK